MYTIHGHRGCRGYYPDNSIKGFVEAKRLNVDAIELDVVVSKDLKLIVSHDPWLTPGSYMINKTGEVPENEVNLFQTVSNELEKYALGTKRNLKFPKQIPSAHQIPTLEEVINHTQLQDVYWNIEIKSYPEWYDVYQPQPEIIADLVYNFIKDHHLESRCMVQSFDHNFLNTLYKYQVTFPLGFLVENNLDWKQNLSNLNFKPDFYNPKEGLIDQKLLIDLKGVDIKCLAWTVNKLSRAKQLLSWKIDGLITDYPPLL